MHHIQKSIILNLARTSPLRFSELQPPRIPNNTFSYHLKKLIAGGYVELTRSGYVATRKSLKLVAYGVNTNKAPSTPMMISMVYVENNAGEVLLISRDHRPFQGWRCLPSGLVHRGETLDQAASREMLEKTTIAAESELERVGVLEIRYVEQATQDIFLHTIAFIYKYKFTGDKRLLAGKATRYGQLYWSDLNRSDILPEVYTVHELLASGIFSYQAARFDEPPTLPPLKSRSRQTQTSREYPNRPYIAGPASAAMPL
ncbi:MAG TPA: NUDIX domain-containing protein [Candidatus Pristimantibacillus sp.]|nr:NUDIX domain-containing protein [Candidatus Pristimantibacillus sp.]